MITASADITIHRPIQDVFAFLTDAANHPRWELLRRCAAAWGSVHGIARLGALGQIPSSVPGDIDNLLYEALDTLRLGWQASGSVGSRR